MGTEHLKAIIDLDALKKHTNFKTVEPSEALNPYVERFWSVQYDLPENTYFTQTIIPNPHFSIVKYNISADTSVYAEGVVKKLFTIDLIGKGWILGAKFHVGGFSAFTDIAMDQFTNEKCHISNVLSSANISNLNMNMTLEQNIQIFENELNTYLENHLLTDSKKRKLDMNSNLARGLVDQIRSNPEIISVDELSNCANMSLRSLQRLFKQYVGVNPKWIIRMFRLQEVKSMKEQNRKIDWATTAQKLGYSDQSHLINDYNNLFKSK